MSNLGIGQFDRGITDWGDNMRVNTDNAQTHQTYEAAAQAAARDAGSELIVERTTDEGDTVYDVYDIEVADNIRTADEAANSMEFPDFNVANRLGGERSFVSSEDGKVRGFQNENPELVNIKVGGNSYFGIETNSGIPDMVASRVRTDEHSQAITLRGGEQVFVTPADFNNLQAGQVDTGNNSEFGQHATYHVREDGWN